MQCKSKNPVTCLVFRLTFIICSLFNINTAMSAEKHTTSADDTILFPAIFFDKYQPNTALDMVNQLPGFKIDDGSGERGFSSSSGNVLIDGRRPTVKQDQPSDILDRIPADKVGRLEVLRGADAEQEVQGQVEVVNVVLKTDGAAATRWEAQTGKYQGIDSIPVNGKVSVSDQWQEVEYNAGLQANRIVRPDRGTESIFDEDDKPSRLTNDKQLVTGFNINSNLNGVTNLMNTQVHFNTKLGYRDANDEFRSNYANDNLLAANPYEILNEDRERIQMEFGLNFERELIPDLSGKFILLYTREDETSLDNQQRFDTEGDLSRVRGKDIENIENEFIARSEYYWTGFANHSPKFSMEYAYNTLSNHEIETRGIGENIDTIFVPGANTTIKENRGDLKIDESWSIANLELEIGLGAEVSQIKQTGDTNLSRSFFYTKPSLLLSYSPNETSQIRLNFQRRVGQLDFDDFVSDTVFADDEIIPGNPNLRPETTWIGSLSYEHRFNEIGVIKITAFHHWISDVEDLLPLTETEEAPGNIGSGRRWGVELESTLPLDAVGINNSRFDIQLYWQDSTVVDPVTGETRKLSSVGGNYFNRNSFAGDVDYQASVDFRQDLIKSRIAWGWIVAFNANRKRYKVNELEIRDDGITLDFFTEKSGWLGLKYRLDLKNMLDSPETRERIIYSRFRDLSSLAQSEFRSYTQGREIELSISGTF